MNLEEKIAAYVRVRAKRDELRAKHKEELAPVNEAMGALEASILADMNEQGVDSVKAKGAGTAYKIRRVSYSVKDWSALLDWIKMHDLFDVLEHRVSKTAVEEFVSGHNGDVPPGLNRTEIIAIGVRKS